MNMYTNTPSICQGNNTCDSRQPHICINGMDLDEKPGWEN